MFRNWRLAEINRDEHCLRPYTSHLAEHYPWSGWDSQRRESWARDTELAKLPPHIELKQNKILESDWLRTESENIITRKHQTKVAAERFEIFFKNYKKTVQILILNFILYVCQLKGNNSQIMFMYLTLLYCEKPILLNLICWLVKINEFYYSPSFIYIIFSATKLQIDENHGILWENYIVQVK